MARIVEENFEGAGYEDSGWAEIVKAGCVLDEDAAIPGTPPLGSGNQCMQSDIVSGGDTEDSADIYIDKSAQNVNYWRFYFYISSETLASSEYTNIFLAQELGVTPVVALVQLVQGGANLYLRLFYEDSGTKFSNLSSILSTGTWYRVEIKYDVTGGTWDFRVDGSSVDSGSFVGTPVAPDRIYVGNISGTSTGAISLYFDLVVWDDANWAEEGSQILYRRRMEGD